MSEANEPAFPNYIVRYDRNVEGLSKREYFAGLAMRGLISRHAINGLMSVESGSGGPSKSRFEYVAELAALHADALLAELEKKL